MYVSMVSVCRSLQYTTSSSKGKLPYPLRHSISSNLTFASNALFLKIAAHVALVHYSLIAQALNAFNNILNWKQGRDRSH